jgi:uncharacterized protein (TIGR02594 family)
MKPRWLEIAEGYIGTTEFKGIRHNPIIVGFWKLIRRSGIKDDETPWCAAFVGGCLEQAGIASTRFESAASYLRWGREIANPVVGCVAVISRSGGNHVFFVIGENKDGTKLVGIGGNQSDAVTIATFDITRIRGYRWPQGIPMGDPLPVINTKVLLGNAGKLS